MVDATMKAAIAKKEFESALANRFGNVFERRAKRLLEFMPTGVAEIDTCLQGFPRGVITEIHGAATSGRASLLLAMLAGATKREESCALVDCSDTFDVTSAAEAGVDFERLLWVRCSNNLERTFKAADLLLHGGGFGLVALNLSDVPSKAARRIISSWWFRFRRAIENTPTALVVITSVACARSCAALVLELKNESTFWPSTLSLISEKSNNELTGKREQSTKLSLVTTTAAQSSPSSSLAHSCVLEGLRIRVNRERPVEWLELPVRFNPKLH
jgi:hypothetical protein